MKRVIASLITTTLISTLSFAQLNELNLSRTKLPENFQGDDIDALYSEIEKATQPKGEFEKTVEYQTRLKRHWINTLGKNYSHSRRSTSDSVMMRIRKK